MILKQNLQDWQVDSAGLRDWNVGVEPQARTQDVLKQHGLKTNHFGRMVHYPSKTLKKPCYFHCIFLQITPQDFNDFDYILAMDDSNMMELQQMASRLKAPPTCKIKLLGSYIGRKEDEIIQDPYFVSEKGEHMLELN